LIGFGLNRAVIICARRYYISIKTEGDLMTEGFKSGRGGYREGSGRPLGSVKAEGVRKQRQMRAYDDEWELINQFARLLKHGHKEECEAFVKSLLD